MGRKGVEREGGRERKGRERKGKEAPLLLHPGRRPGWSIHGLRVCEAQARRNIVRMQD